MGSCPNTLSLGGENTFLFILGTERSYGDISTGNKCVIIQNGKEGRDEVANQIFTKSMDLAGKWRGLV